MARKRKVIGIVLVVLIAVLLLGWHVTMRWLLNENFTKPASNNHALFLPNESTLAIEVVSNLTTKTIDLGYASFALPEHFGVQSELAYNDQGWVVLESNELNLAILPPDNSLLNSTLLPAIQMHEERQSGRVKLLPAEFKNSSGQLENMSMFDLQVLLGGNKPVTFFESLFMGQREITELVTALNMKGVFYTRLPEDLIRIVPFTTEKLVGVIYFADSTGRLHISSKDRKMHQEIAFRLTEHDAGKVTDGLKVFLTSLSYQSDQCCYTAKEVIEVAKNKGFKRLP